jgi:hypothetical protein
MATPEHGTSKGFEPKPTLEYASKVTMQAGGVGLFVSALQNALGKHSYGAMGVLTRTGGTVAFSGVSGLA